MTRQPLVGFGPGVGERDTRERRAEEISSAQTDVQEPFSLSFSFYDGCAPADVKMGAHE
jgi:hypothetical protein